LCRIFRGYFGKCDDTVRFCAVSVRISVADSGGLWYNGKEPESNISNERVRVCIIRF